MIDTQEKTLVFLLKTIIVLYASSAKKMVDFARVEIPIFRTCCIKYFV